MICALPALWTGLLYDEHALGEAAELAKGLTASDVADARMEAAQHGLRGQIGGRSMHDLAKKMIDIATDGLRRRNQLDLAGNDETGFLDPIRKITVEGMTQADHLMQYYDQDWDQDLSQVYRKFSLLIIGALRTDHGRVAADCFCELHRYWRPDTCSALCCY